MYVKSESTCHELDVPEGIIQAAGIQLQTMDKALNMYAVYRLPNSSLENNARINEFIRGVDKNTLIFGDFNYPNVNWELMSGNSYAWCIVPPRHEESFREESFPFSIFAGDALPCFCVIYLMPNMWVVVTL